MKKKVLSLFLAASIAASSLAVPVSAAETGLSQELDLDTDLNLDELLFDQKYKVYTETDHCSVLVTSAAEEFAEMDVVEFLVIPDSGYEVDSISAISAAGNVDILQMGDGQYMFFMPAGDVYLSAFMKTIDNPSLEFNEDDPILELPELYGETADETKPEEADIQAGITQDTDTEEIPDDFDYTVINSENVDELLQESSLQDEQLVESIEEGQVIALAPVDIQMESEAVLLSDSSDSDAGIMALADVEEFTDRKFRIINGPYCTCEEVWNNTTGTGTHLGTMYRKLQYYDESGTKRTSPLYCLIASNEGPLTAVDVKEEACSVLTNSTLKKMMYFGFGGPGDICDDYDPTCSHINWNNDNTRYLFTHMALSKTYSGDVGGATAAECEHAGLNKWITKLKSMTLPNITDLKFNGVNSSGNKVSAKDMVTNLYLYRVTPESLSWTGFDTGLQVSNIFTLTASEAGNGIKITKSETSTWMFGYWTSAEDYNTRGASNPRILKTGASVTLKTGAKFRYAYPRNISAVRKLNTKSILKLVQYIMIDGTQQFGDNKHQDFSAYYLPGDSQTLSLTMNPDTYGSVLLTKTADNDPSEFVAGAGYTLYAAADIYSHEKKTISKGTAIETRYTNASGQVKFSVIPAGKYYLLETDPKEGSEAENYLIDTTKYSVTVTASGTAEVHVSEIPKMDGKVSIRKVIKDTELDLEGAVFTLYTWSKASGKYTNGVDLTYDAAAKRYVSPTVSYTADNQGKFRVKETKNPKGFTGSWSEDFVLTKLNQEEMFERTVENETSPRRVAITKIDSKTKENLEGAEFTIYPWNKINGDYESIGQLLRYDAVDEKYYSEELEITDLNVGRFKIVETKNPDGHTGTWEREIDLNDADAELQYTVENLPITPNPHGTIEIIKTDSDTGERLEGAEFTIYQWNNSVGRYENTLGDKANVPYRRLYECYASDELEINDQNSGKFKVVETRNPVGYTGTWEKEFVLSAQTPELTFNVTNDPDKPPMGEITVVKKIKESDILWAHGDPTFLFVVEGTDAKGIKHKYEDYVSFSKKSYVVDADGYAALQITFKNVPIGQYQAYERPVLYYYLTDVIANTSNVSVVKGQTPKYGLNPRDIGYGNIQLTKENKTASITFVNTKDRYDRFVHNDVVKNRIPITFQ